MEEDAGLSKSRSYTMKRLSAMIDGTAMILKYVDGDCGTVGLLFWGLMKAIRVDIQPSKNNHRRFYSTGPDSGRAAQGRSSRFGLALDDLGRFERCHYSSNSRLASPGRSPTVQHVVDRSSCRR